MRRRQFLLFGGMAAAALVLDPPGARRKEAMAMPAKTVHGFEPLKKPLSEWSRLLPRDRYAILFEEATERPFSSVLNHEKRAGTYVCAACFLPLFGSDAKFDSGTGWPSFFQPLPGRVGTQRDFKLIFPRTEYHCARCGGHQGHLFEDGPPPTGKRYCNNGLALDFFTAGEPLPKLRG